MESILVVGIVAGIAISYGLYEYGKLQRKKFMESVKTDATLNIETRQLTSVLEAHFQMLIIKRIHFSGAYRIRKVDEFGKVVIDLMQSNSPDRLLYTVHLKPQWIYKHASVMQKIQKPQYDQKRQPQELVA